MFQTSLCFTLKRVSSIKSEIINKKNQELIQSFYLLSCKSAQVRKINTELILKSKVSELKFFTNQRLTFSLFRRKVSLVDFEWWCNGHTIIFVTRGLTVELSCSDQTNQVFISWRSVVYIHFKYNINIFKFLES